MSQIHRQTDGRHAQYNALHYSASHGKNGERIKCKVRNCQSSKLTMYTERNKTAKLNSCIETTTENERSVQCERKMSNQYFSTSVKCQTTTLILW